MSDDVRIDAENETVRGPCIPVVYCGLATSTHVPVGSDEDHCDLCGHPAQPYSQTNDPPEYDLDAPPDYSADNAADFILHELAKALNVEFRPAEGSETWEGDVLGTMWHALTDSGVIDEWDNSLRVQPQVALIGDSGPHDNGPSSVGEGDDEEPLPDFSDDDVYEAIEELQLSAAMADQEPMEALFSDTALLVRFLIRERDQAKSEQYKLSMEVVRLDLALEDNKQAAKEEKERITEQMGEWRSVARRWYALDAGSWHVQRHDAEKAALQEETRAVIENDEGQS